VTDAQIVLVAGCREPLGGKVLNRLEHPEARLGRVVAPLDQALVRESLENFDVRVAHHLGRLERATAGEDGEAPEEGLLVRGQQVVAPFQRRPERLLARLEVAAALQRLYGARLDLEPTARLIGSRENVERIRAGDDPAAIAASWSASEARWRLLRSKYLLYR